MASTEVAKTEIQEIENPSEPNIVEQSQGSNDINSEKSSETGEPESNSAKKDNKKKRPFTTFHGSLKRHAPVFFTKKRESDSNVGFKKSAEDMWSDVKSVFGRLSLKKGKF